LILEASPVAETEEILYNSFGLEMGD